MIPVENEKNLNVVIKNDEIVSVKKRTIGREEKTMKEENANVKRPSDGIVRSESSKTKLDENESVAIEDLLNIAAADTTIQNQVLQDMANQATDSTTMQAHPNHLLPWPNTQTTELLHHLNPKFLNTVLINSVTMEHLHKCKHHHTMPRFGNLRQK